MAAAQHIKKVVDVSFVYEVVAFFFAYLFILPPNGTRKRGGRESQPPLIYCLDQSAKRAAGNHTAATLDRPSKVAAVTHNRHLEPKWRL